MIRGRVGFVLPLLSLTVCLMQPTFAVNRVVVAEIVYGEC